MYIFVIWVLTHPVPGTMLLGLLTLLLCLQHLLVLLLGLDLEEEWGFKDHWIQPNRNQLLLLARGSLLAQELLRDRQVLLNKGLQLPWKRTQRRSLLNKLLSDVPMY